MAAIPDKPVKITMETQDGRVFDLTGMVVSLQAQSNYSEFDLTQEGYSRHLPVSTSWSMEIEGIGPIMQFFREEWRVQSRMISEWKCPYCGHINPRNHRVCGSGEAAGCGAPRPFIYGG